MQTAMACIVHQFNDNRHQKQRDFSTTSTITEESRLQVWLAVDVAVEHVQGALGLVERHHCNTETENANTNTHGERPRTQQNNTSTKSVLCPASFTRKNVKP